MPRRILILDGHPDPASDRFVHALAGAYGEGAREGRHEVMTIRAADIDFPLLRTQTDYERGSPVAEIRRCQEAFDWANHVVILYPLWLGSMPAVLKGLLEQMFRPGFAFSTPRLGRWPAKLQEGKSARIVVTTGMPGWAYRWFYRAHSVRSLKRNVLRLMGFRRVGTTIIGAVASVERPKREQALVRMRELGRGAR